MNGIKSGTFCFLILFIPLFRRMHLFYVMKTDKFQQDDAL